MPEMNEDTTTLLEALRHADEPTEQDAARVRGAVWARLGITGAAVGLGVTGIANSVAAPGTAGAAAGSAGLAGAEGALLAASKAGVWLTVIKVGLAVSFAGAGVWYGVSNWRAPAEGGAAVARGSANSAVLSLSAASSAALPNSVELEPGPPAASQLPAIAALDPDAPAATRSTAVRRGGRESSQGNTLNAEVSLLSSAQQALAQGRHAAALRTLEEHARRFPRGTLSGEREASKAIALCGSGQRARGSALARGFLQRNPDSPLGARLRAACQLK